jgi:hypothetical protein
MAASVLVLSWDDAVWDAREPVSACRLPKVNRVTSVARQPDSDRFRHPIPRRSLHVSLSDITQILGTGSVPVVVAGSVLGVFELGERLASQRAKDALSRWLLTFDVRQAGALPDGTRELFDRLFGKRHFSLKCFIRSVMFSLGAMAFLGILMFLIYPKGVLSEIAVITSEIIVVLAVALRLLWSIIIDYISLFKTRIILRTLTQLQRESKVLESAVLVMDYLFYLILFAIGELATMMGGFYIVTTLQSESYWPMPPEMLAEVLEAWFKSYLTLFPIDLVEDPVSAIFFWAGLAPSLWMWLYVAALFVTRALLRSERIVNWLRWCLDVEKNPFRSIGAVAGALTFIVSVALILVSAEVSRIGAAA